MYQVRLKQEAHRALESYKFRAKLEHETFMSFSDIVEKAVAALRREDKRKALEPSKPK